MLFVLKSRALTEQTRKLLGLLLLWEVRAFLQLEQENWKLLPHGRVSKIYRIRQSDLLIGRISSFNFPRVSAIDSRKELRITKNWD
jgi:hypothetical protein